MKKFDKKQTISKKRENDFANIHCFKDFEFERIEILIIEKIDWLTNIVRKWNFICMTKISISSTILISIISHFNYSFALMMKSLLNSLFDKMRKWNLIYMTKISISFVWSFRISIVCSFDVEIIVWLNVQSMTKIKIHLYDESFDISCMIISHFDCLFVWCWNHCLIKRSINDENKSSFVWRNSWYLLR